MFKLIAASLVLAFVFALAFAERGESRTGNPLAAAGQRNGSSAVALAGDESL